MTFFSGISRQPLSEINDSPPPQETPANLAWRILFAGHLSKTNTATPALCAGGPLPVGLVGRRPPQEML